MPTVYNLFFYNDACENEHYGTFSTREGAEAVIADLQAEHGTDAFWSDNFTITENEVK